MSNTPLCAVFDVGKTNKKLLLFNEDYEIVEEQSVRLAESMDEDGFPCEDVQALSTWIRESLAGMLARHPVRAVNVSAYGASFVHVDESGHSMLPLDNYLRPFPAELQMQFDAAYGDRVNVETASPRLGNLNSGMQLYRINHVKPKDCERIRYSLHLPSYLSTLIGGAPYTEISSVGCHTLLWDFTRRDYHDWVKREGLTGKFAPFREADQVEVAKFDGKKLLVGTGLHDSSSALIPYLLTIRDSFILLSTGTWNIALNPFNNEPLTAEQLSNDCLNYLSYTGTPVKASRLHAGPLHEAIAKLPPVAHDTALNDIVEAQVRAISWIDNPVPSLFVDGGFSQNQSFMRKLAERLRDKKVAAAVLGQASAMGAALVIHRHWNPGPIPRDLVRVVDY